MHLHEFLTEYALYLLLALGLGICSVWLFVMRKRLNIRPLTSAMLGVTYTLFGVLSVKLFAFLETGFSSASFGNMSLFGGVFFMPVCFYVTAKIVKVSERELVDVVTPSMLFMLLLMRINCLLSGCCKGVIISGTGHRFPSREAEILLYIVLIVCFCYQVLRKQSNGTVYPVFMLSYGVFRFVMEFFRATEPQTLFHMAHLWALLSAVFGAAIYFETKTATNEKKHRERK